jgi:hypothetical protein
MLEIIVTSILLGTVIATLAPAVSACAAHHRMSELRRCGMQDLSNALERVSLVPFEKLDEAVREPVEPSAPCRRRLPDARITLSVTDAPGDLRAKRITAELHWSAPGGAPQPMYLSTWRYADGRTE